MDTQNFQDLQEISKKLLGSYVAKAGEDLRRNKNKEFLKRDDAAWHASGGNRHTGPNPELAAQARADAKTYSDKASRRARGLAMAGKKIANESALREYVNNVVKGIFENRDIFDALDNKVMDDNAKAKINRQNLNTQNFNKHKSTQKISKISDKNTKK